MPTALDNGRRSPRKLLRAVVARLLGRSEQPEPRLDPAGSSAPPPRPREPLRVHSRRSGGQTILKWEAWPIERGHGRNRAPSTGRSLAVYVQVSVTGLVSPFGFDAVQWKICVVTGWKISSVIFVSVRVGFTPDQFGFGQPAVAPDTVGAAVKVAGFVVNVRFPFLIALAGMAVSEVAGPASTLF